VQIGYPFYFGKYEITQAQWLAVMGSWPGTAPNSVYGLGDDYPAYYVSWGDCQAFVDGLNQTGQGTFRLPSEAEWEYACRGSESNSNRYDRFYFGDSDCPSTGATTCNLGDYAWWSGNSQVFGTKVVGMKIPNDYGLYDVCGNVWEWCLDYSHDDYTGAPADGSAWTDPTSSYRITRGGSWQLDANYCRSAYRNNESPASRAAWFGFRVVRETN
jgi:formylglycine-generating enzyme required for sulfatase activity